MKRYIKSFNYEVDEYGYPTHDGISFVSDSDMLDYIADDDETEVIDNPSSSDPNMYVVRKTGGSRYYGEPYATTGCYIRNGKAQDCYECDADRFTLLDAKSEVAKRNQRCRNSNPWIYEKAE